MKSCLVLVSDEKLARAVSAALVCAGIAVSDGNCGDADGRLVIVDEKSPVPENAACVIALYREERWLRSGTHAELTERFGDSYTALRRPFLYAGDDGLAGAALRLPERGSVKPTAVEGQDRPSETLPEETPPAEENPPERREPPRLVSDPERGTVSYGGRTVHLTEREFALFSCLQAHAGEIVTREELRGAVWHDEVDPAANVTDVYVSYLRKKLSKLFGDGEGAGQAVLTSVRGKGYLLRLLPMRGV